eukprot:CAMPEP_0172672688 /NCGR_PEP_ID=MMETSP1074-20121228/11700_1 /TAXON_ID=2916 /ORGANISM="Ceratium fusus, Strain PA161109" /LENGTH=48 /DNA_ID= /DNA_START= /DNA_END= /DNA_ORIENTATION=
MILTKFLELIRGAFMPAPTMLDPVKKMPQAAPMTDTPSAMAMPMYDHM